SVLHGLAVFHVDLLHCPVKVALDLVHQLHGFHDGHDLSFLYCRSDRHIGIRILCRSCVECSHQGALHDLAGGLCRCLLFCCLVSLCSRCGSCCLHGRNRHSTLSRLQGCDDGLFFFCQMELYALFFVFQSGQL